MDLSIYAPSFRLKQLAWGGYGFGHTCRRESGALRGTVVGRRGRFRDLLTKRGGALQPFSKRVNLSEKGALSIQSVQKA
jgi:hypothetical protein